jgi:hypothetical protein
LLEQTGKRKRTNLGNSAHHHTSAATKASTLWKLQNPAPRGISKSETPPTIPQKDGCYLDIIVNCGLQSRNLRSTRDTGRPLLLAGQQT